MVNRRPSSSSSSRSLPHTSRIGDESSGEDNPAYSCTHSDTCAGRGTFGEAKAWRRIRAAVGFIQPTRRYERQRRVQLWNGERAADNSRSVSCNRPVLILPKAVLALSAPRRRRDRVEG